MREREREKRGRRVRRVNKTQRKTGFTEHEILSENKKNENERREGGDNTHGRGRKDESCANRSAVLSGPS